MAASAALKYGSVLSVAILCFAIYYRRNNADEALRQRLEHVLHSLLRAERKVSVAPKTKVALGLGSCLDVTINATDLFTRIALEQPTEPRHHGSIQGARQLAESFAYHFSHGAAAERYIHDQEFFRHLVDTADDIPTSKWSMGGNALVMANRMAIEGCEVLLGSKVSQKLRKLLHEDVIVTGIKDVDDIHMALEYKTGEKWGQYEAPRANRLLINSDVSNPKLEGMEEFRQQIKEFKPNAVVVGGLQMMDSYPHKEGEREELLGNLRNILKELPSEMKVHFEMASFSEEAMMHELLTKIIPYSDSMGSNEQEIANLYSLLNYGNITLVSNAYPRVATVLDQMRSVYRMLRNLPKVDGKQRPLTRIHIHTVAFQAILTKKGSSWKNTMASAAKASLTANRYVCDVSKIDKSKSMIIMDESFAVSREEGSKRMPFHADRPVSCWDEDDYEICVAPVMVCTDIHRTAGAGDNVSAAGLVLQI